MVEIGSAFNSLAVPCDTAAKEKLTPIGKNVHLAAAQNTLEGHEGMQSKFSGSSLSATVNPQVQPKPLILERKDEGGESQDAMKILSLSWVVQVDSPGIGGCIYFPEWDAVLEKLNIVLQSGGSVSLDAEDETDKSRSLQVRAENSRFLLTMGVETENGWVVRGFNNPKAEALDESVSLLGDCWSAARICHDQEIVKAVFLEFFGAGEVSTRYLE